ncbi:MAG: Crp/Fnr family transcriptional regulator [Acidimicrobiales bacterium]
MGFLDALDAAAAAELRSLGRPRHYPRGSLLFAEGDVAHEVVVILHGAVKVVATATSGRQVVLEVLEDGALLGELSAMDGGDRSATAIALTPVEVLALPQSAFRRLVNQHPELAAALLHLLAERLRGASRRQLEFGANDALGRLCQRLEELVRRHGAADGAGRTVIELPFSQQDLAAWAGLSREAVVKGLRALRTLGWVEAAGRRLVFLDEAAVHERARQ